ncbi:hypothetical protein [Amycolatopsis sp. NPDC052450]|uniref:hypothetical protein n=1 Tax=Amycolatopsis sp. NPDC052450 TaxID=3363937 RepID=UPI0037CB06AF
MDKRDRDLLASIARVNADIGKATLDLLTLQPSDEHYAAGRASELDGQELPADLFGIEAAATDPLP